MNTKLSALVLVSLFALGPSYAAQNTSESVQVLVADEPLECLSLESLILDGDNYIIVDGRNNRGRVKFMRQDGTIVRAGISTIPLPNAASLPGDTPPCPFGLDRVVRAKGNFWATPAPWVTSAAELFDTETGAFVDRLPGLGFPISGLVLGPSGGVWIVAQNALIEISSEDLTLLNLAGSLAHIDTVTGHPLGFVVFSQPDLFLVETSGVIRWRVDLDSITDRFLSPLDIAAGADGTIAVCAVLCEFSDPSMRDEYFSLRRQCIEANDEQALFGVEDAIRSVFGTEYVIILLTAEGAITDTIQSSTPVVACAVDQAGRVHILTQEAMGWALSILDPRINEGIPVCLIPYGEPGMVSPHRLASGPDGSLYWDDLIPGEAQRWGIARLSPGSASSVFALGDLEPRVTWVYEETVSDSIRVATSMACGAQGDLWVGVQDFPWDLPSEADESQPEEAHASSVLHLDKDGNLLRRHKIPAGYGTGAIACELQGGVENMMAVWAGVESGIPLGAFGPEGTWNPLAGFPLGNPVANARIEQTADGFVGWFLQPGYERDETFWFHMGRGFDRFETIDRFNALACRLLATDPQQDEMYLTIDDGEVFRVDASSLLVTAIWTNRVPGGAPGHPLDDATWRSDGLAVLDREHRAVISVSREAFGEPPLCSSDMVNEAVQLVRDALEERRRQLGFYPPPSVRLLEDIMDPADLQEVRGAFLGGRIYNYEATETGYHFTAWSAAADQPALICDSSDLQTIY